MSQLQDALAPEEGYRRTQAFKQYLISKAFEKGIPLNGHFELTPRCNLDCKMCYVHLQKKQMHKDELSTQEWITLIDQACEAGMMYATLTGGECLLYQGFREIFDYLQSRGILVTVLTNGTLLDEETVAWLLERSPQRIQISVYGSCSEGYKNVTGSGVAFYKVDRGIDLLIKAGLPLNFAVTVSKQLLPDLKAILRYCDSKKKGVTRVNPSLFEAKPNTGRESKSFAINLDEKVEVFRIQQEVFNESCIQDYSTEMKCESDILFDSSVHKEKGIVCTAGRFGFAIGWDGKMTPCNLFNFAERYPLNEGFQSAWTYINSKCRDYKNPTICIRCKYNKVCIPCPASHYMKVGEGSVDSDICAERKRMFEEIT